MIIKLDDCSWHAKNDHSQQKRPLQQSLRQQQKTTDQKFFLATDVPQGFLKQLGGQMFSAVLNHVVKNIMFVPMMWFALENETFSPTSTTFYLGGHYRWEWCRWRMRMAPMLFAFGIEDQTKWSRHLSFFVTVQALYSNCNQREKNASILLSSSPFPFPSSTASSSSKESTDLKTRSVFG